eukprot:m.159987 g.159987  ORF g.159987 m.159987 type:complete len:400 (-) comp17048_c2_seq4:102-1301(-)
MARRDRESLEPLLVSARPRNRSLAQSEGVPAVDNVPAFWTVLPTLGESPSPRLNATLVYVPPDDVALLFGGYSVDLARVLGELWSLDLTNDTWTLIEPHDPVRPPAVSCHSAVLLGESLVVFGGKGQDGYVNTLFEFDLAKEQWIMGAPTPKSPKPRIRHSAVVFQNSMYVLGGLGKDGKNFSELWRCSRTTSGWSWTLEGKEAPALHSHSAVVYNGSMWVLGGVGADATIANVLHCFSFHSHVWTRIESGNAVPVEPRVRHSALVVGRQMVLIGGCGLAGSNDYVRHIGLYDFEARTWEAVRPEVRAAEDIDGSEPLTRAVMQQLGEGNEQYEHTGGNSDCDRIQHGSSVFADDGDDQQQVQSPTSHHHHQHQQQQQQSRGRGRFASTGIDDEDSFCM